MELFCLQKIFQKYKYKNICKKKYYKIGYSVKGSGGMESHVFVGKQVIKIVG